MLELFILTYCLAMGAETHCFDVEFDNEEPPRKIQTFYSWQTYILRADEHGYYYETWQTHLMPTVHVQAECGKSGIAIAVDGCAYLDGSNKIFMTWDSLDRLDRYGQTIYWHEIRHAMCMCDWHG